LSDQPTHRLNILVAYPYFDKDMEKVLSKVPHDEYRLIVDSGAFSAWNSGHEIKLDDYCEFLRRIEGKFAPFRAVQLDVYGNPQATMVQYREMRDRGLDVMPVFTRGDTPEALDYFCSTADYLMFGGIATGRDNNRNYVKWFMEMLRKEHPGKQVHRLGFTDMDFVKVFRPASLDNSSHTIGMRFGHFHLYKGGGVLAVYGRKDFARRPDPTLVGLMEKMGFGFEEMRKLAQAEAWVGHTWQFSDLRGFMCLAGMVAHVYRAYEVERRLGTKIYLACAKEYQIRMVFEARRWLIQKGIIEAPLGEPYGWKQRPPRPSRAKQARVPDGGDTGSPGDVRQPMAGAPAHGVPGRSGVHGGVPEDGPAGLCDDQDPVLPGQEAGGE
jgi:hypothetical protein